MDSHQVRKFDMLRRVQQFLDKSAAPLAAVNATAARKELDALVKELAASEAQEAIGRMNARGETSAKQKLRVDLWKHHMRPVATIAAAHLRQAPQFAAMQMPQYKVSAAGLVQAAVAMADVARAHAEVFVQNGRPETFADDLVAAAAAMRASIDSRAKSIGGKAEARKGLKAASKRAEAVVRLLDAQVKSVLVDDPKLLAGWTSAKRVGKGKVASIEPAAAPAPAQPGEVKAA